MGRRRGGPNGQAVGRHHPALRDGIPFCIGIPATGSEAPAYYSKRLSEAPSVLLIGYPPRAPCTGRVRVKSAKPLRGAQEFG
jgi:hypothetical protein